MVTKLDLYRAKVIFDFYHRRQALANPRRKVKSDMKALLYDQVIFTLCALHQSSLLRESSRTLVCSF